MTIEERCAVALERIAAVLEALAPAPVTPAVDTACAHPDDQRLLFDGMGAEPSSFFCQVCKTMIAESEPPVKLDG